MTEQSPEHTADPVVVAVYAHVGEAEVSKAHLAANGIAAFIVDEVEGGTLYVEGESGVLVVVQAQDAELARRVLTPDPDDQDAPSQG